MYSARQVLHFQIDLAGLIRLRRELVAKLAADHEADDVVHLQLGCRTGRYQLAVAHDGDLVGDALDLRHFMGNIDDAHAAVPEHVDDPEQMLNLFLGQRGRGFIKYDDFRVIGDSLCDLHHLTLGNRHRAHDPVGVYVDAELFKNRFGIAKHLVLVHNKARDLGIAARATGCP